MENISLTNYIPAFTQEDIQEREYIINKYKHALSHEIEYYLIYHNCDEFAVLLWTILRSHLISADIISQSVPFHHTYLQTKDGKIMDILLDRCGVKYPYDSTLVGVVSKKYASPHEFYSDMFIPPPEYQQEWEIKLLKTLKELE